MKIQTTTYALAAALSFGAAQTSDAALLSVDFGSAGAESGFFQQNSTSQTHGTGSGDVTITLAGTQGIFNFATTGTNDLLYRDFYFKNGGTITMTISGPGIDENTAYDMTFWS